MSIVTETMKAQFPDAQHSFTEAFSAVADGLASPLGKGRDQPVEVISLLVTKNVQYSVLWYLHAMGNAVAFE